jgi:transcriptional regulator with PAS, ATPase and Fis domain
MRKIFDVLPEIAGAEAPVFIAGESGTGKELIAQSLHDLSCRKAKPFVAINCAALPDTLLESELFGYRAGAFTDAKKDKPGKFAIAEGGTIFFDEIGDISPAMQVKLLRVLQEKKYEPLGGTATVKTDVRVIAATNRDLDTLVKSGGFREDLYYRINVVAVKLPPLRHRRCDIPLLCDHFIERFNARYNKSIKGIAQEAMEAILAHDFPGNIRELENLIEHAFVFCKSDSVEVQHLPAAMRSASEGAPGDVLSRIDNFDELERMYITAVLKEVNGNKERAAQKLGIHKATLFRRLKKLGMQ